MDGARDLVHGTAIAAGGRAALIRGASGSGKSDLALRCLAVAPFPLLPDTVYLVSDDQVIVERLGEQLRVRAPDTIKGRIEVRCVGIIEVPSVAEAQLVLAVDLVEPGTCERLPDPVPAAAILGLKCPVLQLSPFEISSPLKLLLALRGVAAT